MDNRDKMWMGLRRNVVEDHLIVNGFVHGYNKWIFHGEGFSSRKTACPSSNEEGSDIYDDIDGLLHDTFRNVEDDLGHKRVRDGPSEDANRFFKLLEEGKEELYPGCENFSKLDFTIRLYLFKCIYGMSNVAFTDLLELLKEAFPWKNVFNVLTNKKTKTSAKVLRYFPLKPWLQRIFMCPEIAVAMKWHAIERLNDGNIRHPADSDAWKEFDSLHPEFSSDPRNTFLPPEHPFRRDKKSFDGKEDHRLAHTPLSDTEVLEELREFKNVFGKGQKKRSRDNKCPWKKRSIFFELPYWETNKLRHNLDLMHNEKNICDSILGTLLEIDEK
ncbi:uncharacterized protein LOC142163788 [Nicotiana tabacum]|uniref:Uncharacterized protein LOC142163788 n=1 Tax=Nicotiana tabacum TaxID=4097 RepID=A0AC58RWC7_TOBAC